MELLPFLIPRSIILPSSLLSPLMYLYHRIYAWNLRVWGESDLPQFNALFGVSFLLFLNLMTFVTVIEIITGSRFPVSRDVTLASALAILGISYFLLVHDGKYKRIAKDFSKETPTQRQWRFILCVIYVVLSCVSVFWVIERFHR